MPQASERSLATPMTRPCFPAISAIRFLSGPRIRHGAARAGDRLRQIILHEGPRRGQSGGLWPDGNAGRLFAASNRPYRVGHGTGRQGPPASFRDARAAAKAVGGGTILALCLE